MGASTVVMNSSNNEVPITKIYGIAALINVVLNLLFIPHYSYLCTAFATVISEILISILMFRLTLKTCYAPGWIVVKILLNY